ncbi:CDP-diacylglycerol--glycerol-3-phosphate 3-phosphatidyltransferase [hydrothermal vent metagenome]|uniref:CDP-diacylglycerol--glycerol-3-phosphate 3-phosphatidyltransferase n=1 Tax=hydrothermal vent metagenome TaxID=652676 RepID=A0A3B0TV23_9ZZZZ
MSLPNILTLLRIVLIPVIIALILLENSSARWWALALFAIAAITDYFDGMLARKMQLISPLGRMLDPIADKLLVGALLIAFAYEGSLDGLLIWAAVIIMMREISVSGLREFLGAQQIIVNVSGMAKYKTTLQLIALGGLILSPLLDFVQPMVVGLMWLATAITLYTGYEYFAGAWPHLGADQKQKGKKQ